MATIFMEPSETGGMSNPFLTGDWSVSQTQTAGPWSDYSLYSSGTSACQYQWDTAVSTFYGQGRFLFFEYDSLNTDFIKFFSPNMITNLSFRKTSTGEIAVYRGDASTLLGTSTGASISGTVWAYIQWYVVCNDSTGAVTIKVNNSTVLTLTSVDTRNDAGTDGDKCVGQALDLSNAANDMYVDDLIINDTTGSVNNSYPDNLGIQALMPNAAGDNTALTRGGTDSGSNYGQVDERPPSGTDYVYGSVVDNYDLYNIPSTTFSTVASAMLCIRAAASDAGAANIAHIVKADTDTNGTADTEYTGADLALSTSYETFKKIYNQNPDSTDWTAAKINALQIGVKVR